VTRSSLEVAQYPDECAFLLGQPAGRPERRRALIVLVVSAVIFAALAPFAQVGLEPVPAFIPIYESALVMNDTITAVLLFGQYRILRSRALAVLASGYLFAALMTAGHALSFPGLFSSAGLLGAGPQSTAWIYMFWHSAFPLFVLGYAWMKRRPDEASATSSWHSLVWPIVAVALAGGLLGLATTGQSLLPAIMQGNRYTPATHAIVFSVWLFSLAALAVLWRGRPHSVLDLWLGVLLCAWLFDIALSAMLNAGRYDVGFYAGRIYGLIASSIVLWELLLENGMLHARLARAHVQERARNAELRAARDEAQAANAAKSLFLASMSHEIRTPMNAVVGLTHLVLQTQLDDRQRDYLSSVQSSSKALLTLLNDILDYSKIEAGKVTLEQEEFNAEEAIENVGNLFSARIDEAGLELFFEIGPGIPQRLLGDSLRLTQVLNNLVGNAIKFTPRGEIVVGVGVVSRDEWQVELEFKVRDTGIGLSDEQAKKLFQVFGQADASTSRRYGGTGLGLAICHRLVELMGGSLSVTSVLAEGSTFAFTSRFGVPKHDVERMDLHRIRGMRTLVVDGQPTARLLLQQMLLSWRFQVAAAANANEALLKLRRADATVPFELLVVDLKTVGLELLQEARGIVLDAAGTPLSMVVLVSGQARERADEAMRSLPEADLLLKPITPSRLFDTIVQVQHGGDARPMRQGATKPDLFERLAPIRGARVLLAEDNLVNQQVALAFLSMGGLHATVANNGREAVDLVKSQPFDIVLMDMQMPEMDGPQAARLIRKMPDAAQLPIVAMTAAAMEGDKQECLAAGMNAHVSKPIDPQELIGALLTWVPHCVAAQDKTLQA